MKNPTTPGIAELLDALERAASATCWCQDERLAILSYVAGLERERDGALQDGEIVNVLRHALASRQREFLANYRRGRTTYREGASDAADMMLTVFDRAIAQRGGKDA